MKQKTKNTCPTCQGNKTSKGVCECNMEWRGTQSDDGWDDCQCTPDTECPTCHGKGFVEARK